ncbi:MAG: hypothetical protein Kow00107_02570 [Planctomycetota bacterium]
MHSRRAGFTIFEFIVVAGILLCLVMLIAPMVSRAMQEALQTRCQGNLRTMHQAFEQYRQSNKGRYPLSKSDFGSSLLMLRDYLPDVESYARCPSNRVAGSYSYDPNHNDADDDAVVLGDSPSYDELTQSRGPSENHGGLIAYYLKVNGTVIALYGTVYRRRVKVNKLQLLDDIFSPDTIFRDDDSYLRPIDI